MLSRAPRQSRSAEIDAQTLLVSLDNVVFQAGGKRLLDGLDLRLFAGPKTVIMGPNGAGKSLTLRLLQGLLEPQFGQIEWQARDVARPALVFQRPTLLRRSVAANLRHALAVRGFPRSARRERIDELLDLGDLTDLRDQPARRLSGGEQQRLAVVRALAASPGMLLLDEPTASLDPAATAAIEALVNAAHAEGTKIVFVTHDAGQARRIGDEVVFLHRGRVCERAPADAFFTQPKSAEARAYLQGRLLLE